MAQGVPDLSIIDKRIKEGEKPRAPEGPSVAPRVEEAPGKPPATEPFTLSGVIIEGATVFAPADLTNTYEGYLLKRVGDPEIAAILKAISQRYQEAGYFLSRALVPAQDFVNGIIRIRVVEGYVAKFTVAGDYPHTELLDRYARPMLTERPARLGTVERTLLLMSDLPGLTLEPTLKPVREESGEYALTIDTEYRPVSAFARLDNRGTPDVGRLQGWVGAGHFENAAVRF